MKVLKFPYLVQKKLLGDMDLSRVIMLSMMNKRMKRVIDSCKFKINKWFWFGAGEIFLRKEGHEKEGCVIFEIMQPNPNPSEKFVSNLGNRNVRVAIRDPKTESAKFDVNFLADPQENKLESKMRLNELISRFLLSFIDPATYELDIQDKKLNIETLFFWDITKNYNSFCVEPFSSPFVLSEDTLKFLLGNVTARNMNLYVKCPSTNFQFERPNLEPKGRIITLRRADFFHFEKFVDTLNFPHIVAFLNSIEPVNQILKGWIHGENNVMKTLFLRFDSEYEEESGDEEEEDDVQVRGDGSKDEDNDEKEDDNRDEIESDDKDKNGNSDEKEDQAPESEDEVDDEDDNEDEDSDESDDDEEQIEEVRNAIFDGINVTQPTMTEEQWRSHFPAVPMAKASEIRRECDSRRATLFVNAGSINMSVWSDADLQGNQAIQDQ